VQHERTPDVFLKTELPRIQFHPLQNPPSPHTCRRFANFGDLLGGAAGPFHLLHQSNLPMRGGESFPPGNGIKALSTP